MSQVVRIQSAKWPEIAQALRKLLARAERGELQAVAVAYECDQGFGHHFVLGKNCSTMEHK